MQVIVNVVVYRERFFHSANQMTLWWLAQWVEHQTDNLTVVGSNPAPIGQAAACPP
jgi:hypothetical protein